ncbi:MAG: rhomboid family intramembrane serine protease [Bacteroidetes bacterium]|nr:MAG: rhomboid family intramembrane serine protease [Bacteroidota bacterium]
MTLIIIIITSLLSFAAFNRKELFYKYNFNAFQIYHRKQWYRMFSYAFLHANYMHLIINMIVLYSFGTSLERYFYYYFGSKSNLFFICLYAGGIVISTTYSLFKNRENYNYNAVGASGAVSAVVFASIFFDPLSKVWFFGIIPIPGIIFAFAYLIYSYYMSKKNIDDVGHDAHFWGAVFGLIYPIILKPELFQVFINRLLNF